MVFINRNGSVSPKFCCVRVCLFVMLSVLGGSYADSCGPGWLAYKNEKCFKIIQQYATQEESASLCQNVSYHQGTLASIDSVEEQTFLKSANNLDEDVWIGAKRSGLQSSPFLWADGLLLTFTNCAQGKPEATVEESDKHCVEIRSQYCNETNGQWHDVSCTKKNYALCQKRQPCQFLKSLIDDLEKKHNQDISQIIYELSKTNELLSQTQTDLANARTDLVNTKTDLENTKTDLVNTQTDLVNTKTDLVNTKTDLVNTKTDLVNTKIELGNRIENRVNGIEGAFRTTFLVEGEVNFYYPVAFKIAAEEIDPLLRIPLAYEIFRTYYEKAPESLNVLTRHYMGLSLKLMVSDGGHDAGSNQCKVIFHDWIYNKGVGKVEIMPRNEYRLFVWLRGGGVLYHIRSPVDMTGSITPYYEQNAETAPSFGDGGVIYPAIIVSPIPVGNEDPDLVKPGLYSGWSI